MSALRIFGFAVYSLSRMFGFAVFSLSRMFALRIFAIAYFRYAYVTVFNGVAWTLTDNSKWFKGVYLAHI